MELPLPGTFKPNEAKPLRGPWWDTRWFALLAIALAAVPLLWPSVPPLTDLPGHMGRWSIELAIDQSPILQSFYEVHWSLIGNLGVDLMVLPVAKLLGIETATKLIVLAIPMLTVAGMLAIAREAHGRVPPTAIMAFPLAYAAPMQWGFVNFQMSQALAYLGFAAWLRLGRQERLGLRTVLMTPFSCLVWLTHSFGWGLFGLLAFGGELARLWVVRGWRRAIIVAFVRCLPLALPLIFMVLNQNGASGPIGGDWFNSSLKLGWFVSILRDRWTIFDALCLTPMIAALYVAARERGIGYCALVGWPALLCLAAFVFLPRLLLGGAYVDARMAPAALTMGLLAIRPPDQSRAAVILALTGLILLGVRTISCTISSIIRSNIQSSELRAIDSLPQGASVLTLVSVKCGIPGADDRLVHIAGLAIVRKQAFVNEQWTLAGQQTLKVKVKRAKPFDSDPSQYVYPSSCVKGGTKLFPAIATFNRSVFDYVWTIGFPPGAARADDLTLVWTNGRSALYRVTHQAIVGAGINAARAPRP